MDTVIENSYQENHWGEQIMIHNHVNDYCSLNLEAFDFGSRNKKSNESSFLLFLPLTFDENYFNL